MNTKNRLLGSSSTIEGITKVISNFYFSKSITLKEINSGVFEVHNSKGLIPSVIVIKKANRFRFEAKQ